MVNKGRLINKHISKLLSKYPLCFWPWDTFNFKRQMSIKLWDTYSSDKFYSENKFDKLDTFMHRLFYFADLFCINHKHFSWLSRAISFAADVTDAFTTSFFLRHLLLIYGIALSFFIMNSSHNFMPSHRLRITCSLSRSKNRDVLRRVFTNKVILLNSKGNFSKRS